MSDEEGVICIGCSSVIEAGGGLEHCEACNAKRVKDVKGSKLRYQDRKKKKRCVESSCDKETAGGARCADHAKKHATEAANARKVRKTLQKCGRCGGKLSPTSLHKLCSPCKGKLRLARLAAKARRKANKTCSKCPLPAREGRSRCEKHK